MMWNPIPALQHVLKKPKNNKHAQKTLVHPCIYAVVWEASLCEADRTAFNLAQWRCRKRWLDTLGEGKIQCHMWWSGEGVEIRAGKDTKLLALVEMGGVKQGGGIMGEHWEKRELRKLRSWNLIGEKKKQRKYWDCDIWLKMILKEAFSRDNVESKTRQKEGRGCHNDNI